MTPEETRAIDGFTVHIYRDTFPSNPWKEWDCEPPIAVYSDDGLRDDFRLVADALDAVSDWKLARHWREIADALGLDAGDLADDVRHRVDTWGGRTADARREILQEEMRDRDRSPRKRLDAAETCYRLADWPSAYRRADGYCQRDWAYVLCVATPEWAKRVGAPAESHERQARTAIDLWQAWAYGDVYGVEIESPDGEDLDSRWGYYGDDHEKSGLMDFARGAIAAEKRKRVADFEAHLGAPETARWIELQGI